MPGQLQLHLLRIDRWSYISITQRMIRVLGETLSVPLTGCHLVGDQPLFLPSPYRQRYITMTNPLVAQGY
jgi:hypothetical protein